MAHDMCKLLVFEYKVVTYEYFMDYLQPFEVPDIIKNLPISTKQDWERTRMIMYASELHVLKRHTKPTDVLHLPWDEKQTNKDHTDLHFNKEQLLAYKDMINQMNEKNKQLNQNGK